MRHFRLTRVARKGHEPIHLRQALRQIGSPGQPYQCQLAIGKTDACATAIREEQVIAAALQVLLGQMEALA